MFVEMPGYLTCIYSLLQMLHVCENTYVYVKKKATHEVKDNTIVEKVYKW